MIIADKSISHDVLLDTYAQPGETHVDDVRRRIAHSLAMAERPAERAQWQARFLAVQQAGFIPAGRIAAQAGTGLSSTMINCFVQPIGDSISEDEIRHPSIYTALAETAETLRRGGGVGLDFSPLRPHGALVAGTASCAAGPLPFIRLFDASVAALQTMDARSGALMGVLRCDHPDIESFVAAKAGAGLLHFNLSVAVTDDFMRRVEADQKIDLVHQAEPSLVHRRHGAVRRDDTQWVYRRVAARTLWQGIVRAAHDHGEPGVLFVDRINADNNLGYCEHVCATNPRGEQPLPPYGACCLGSIDLTRLLHAPFEPHASFDLPALAALVPVAVRMLDNVITLSAWPLSQQREQAQAKRRIGLGFTGLGDALIMLGLPYDSAGARALAERIACCMRDSAYNTSIDLAQERGSFELFDASGLLRSGTFASRLPSQLQDRIRQHGLRNSHLLCIAPAGSVSLAFADNISSGIEPPYAWRYIRHRQLRRSTGLRAYDVEDHAWRVFRKIAGDQAELLPAFVGARDIAPMAHLAMVAAIAPYIDGAISKTVNAPEDCGHDDFEAIYHQAWQMGLKGVTAFRPNRVLGAVLHAPAEGEPRLRRCQAHTSAGSTRYR